MRRNPGRAMTIAIILCVLTVAVAIVWLVGRPPAAAHSILVHCGSSFRVPAEELAQEFERSTGTKVVFNFGGCETLLPAIQVSKKGDIFVCHDPFGDLLRQNGLLAESVTVGQVLPVIAVAKGNPLQIQSLADLARPGVRVGLMDARYSECGKIVREMLKTANLDDAVQKNVKVEVRNHADLAIAIRLQQLDVAIVWNFIGTQYVNDLEIVPAADKYPQTNVTFCLLSGAVEREAAELFLKAAGSPAGRQVFVRDGYCVPKVAAQ